VYVSIKFMVRLSSADFMLLNRIQLTNFCIWCIWCIGLLVCREISAIRLMRCHALLSILDSHQMGQFL